MRSIEPLTASASSVTSTLAKRRSTLTRLVQDLDTLFTATGGRGDELRRTIVAARRVLGVTGAGAGGGRASLELVLDGEPVTLRRGTSLRVGTKSALGESYVDLVPGPARATALRSGVQLQASAVRPAVEVDEALQALDAPTRRSLEGALGVVGEGTRSPRAAEQISGAITGLRASVDGVHDLATLLQDQAGDLSRIVLAGGRVVDELADRTGRVTALVQNGRRTLDAVGARDAALGETVREAPRLLASVRSALREGRPLIDEALPVVADVRAASPDLASATQALPAVADDVDAILARGRRLERAAAPVLQRTPALLDQAAPRPAASPPPWRTSRRSPAGSSRAGAPSPRGSRTPRRSAPTGTTRAAGRGSSSSSTRRRCSARGPTCRTTPTRRRTTRWTRRRSGRAISSGCCRRSPRRRRSREGPGTRRRRRRRGGTGRRLRGVEGRPHERRRPRSW